MLRNAQEIVGMTEIRALAAVATYEDFDSPTSTQRYTERLYRAEAAGFFLMVGRDLFSLSQEATFSWLNMRGFDDMLIDLYCDHEGSEIERGTESDYTA